MIYVESCQFLDCTTSGLRHYFSYCSSANVNIWFQKVALHLCTVASERTFPAKHP